MNEIQPVTHELINELRRKENELRQQKQYYKADDIHYQIKNIQTERIKWLQQQRKQDKQTQLNLISKITYHKKKVNQK